MNHDSMNYVNYEKFVKPVVTAARGRKFRWFGKRKVSLNFIVDRKRSSIFADVMHVPELNPEAAFCSGYSEKKN